MSWRHLDLQMNQWAARLISEVKLPAEITSSLATTIAADIRFLPQEQKDKIKEASVIPLADRLEELVAFQEFMDKAGNIRGNPAMTRAQVIVQNYICFVYLPESCFRVISKVALAGSAARRCAQFLSNNPIRALRNAISHANWTYRADFTAIVYWARKGNDQDQAIERFEVDQEDLNFWQQLARCVAYATYSNL